jgi:hypothetical protein
MNYKHLVNYLGRSFLVSILLSLLIELLLSRYRFSTAINIPYAISFSLMLLSYSAIVIVGKVIPSRLQKTAYIILALPFIAIGCLNLRMLSYIFFYGL